MSVWARVLRGEQFVSDSNFCPRLQTTSSFLYLSGSHLISFHASTHYETDLSETLKELIWGDRGGVGTYP